MPITDYVIQRSPNGSTGWATVADGVNTATSYTTRGLANGIRYYFRVFARNAIGSSGSSSIANAIPVNVLTAARSLTAVPTNLPGQIRLSWTVPLSSGGRAITDYVIQRSANGSTGWATVTDGVDTATAYTVTGLANGVRYYFRVLARTGTITGPPSNVANAIPRTRPTAPRSPGAVPTNLSGQVRLTWLAPASNGGAAITDYIIQRSTDGTSWVSLSDGVNTLTAYTATGLTNGARYYFRVFAKNAAGVGVASPVVNAVPRTVPSQPAFVRVTASFEGFDLEWGTPPSTGGSAITGFVVQAFNFDTNAWVTLGIAPATWRFVFIEMPGEGCASFRVAARNAAGQGAFLGPVTDCWP
jgi:titin